MLGQACEQLGEVDVALDALVTATRLSDGNSKPVGLRGYILARHGQTAAAREVLTMLEELSRVRYVPPFAMALVQAGLGEDEQVFDASTPRMPCATFTSRSSRSIPNGTAIVARLGSWTTRALRVHGAR